VQSGKFQHLLSIQRPVPNQSEGGDIGETWQNVPGFTRIFGEVLPDRAGEFFAARQIQATRNALIRIYYQPGIDETMRVVHHVRPGMDEYHEGFDIEAARERLTKLFLKHGMARSTPPPRSVSS
jgi:SPP1 family predicted phage head-tail adaptor